MERENAIIIALAILVIITACVAVYVTGNGIKFEGESGGEGLNEALVGELDEEIKDEEKKVEENQKEEEIKEEPKVEEVKIEEQPKVEEPIKEQPKKVVGTPKKEVKAEQPKKVNAIEEIKMRMFAKQGGNPQQMLKPIPSSGMELPPGKVPGKLNPAFMSKIQKKSLKLQNSVLLITALKKMKLIPCYKHSVIFCSIVTCYHVMKLMNSKQGNLLNI